MNVRVHYNDMRIDEHREVQEIHTNWDGDLALEFRNTDRVTIDQHELSRLEVFNA